ncbi:MAG: hypothetical protein KAH96_00885 [Alphaproteobacteria bacterium]|nr:hypothetical protein [Alphaproteobacteria bacterium]
MIFKLLTLRRYGAGLIDGVLDEMEEVFKLEDHKEKNKKQFFGIVHRKNRNLYVFTAIVIVAAFAIIVFPVLSSGITAAVAAVAFIKVIEDILDKREIYRDKKTVKELIDERIKCMRSKLLLSGFYDAGAVSMLDSFNSNAVSEKESEEQGNPIKAKKKKRRIKLNPKRFKAKLGLKCG